MMDDDETTFDFYLEMRKEMNRLIIVQFCAIFLSINRVFHAEQV